MKLQNKKTDVVVDVEIRDVFYNNIAKFKLVDNATGSVIAMYNSLAELNAEWEDYEEPDSFYYIDEWECCIDRRTYEDNEDMASFLEELGLKFDTEEEAEKAVEKMKAWTRLRNKGVRFKGWFWDENYGTCIILGDSEENDYVDDTDKQIRKDLDLLFGGENAR